MDTINYVPPSPMLLGSSAAGVVLVKGLASENDAEGFCGYVEVEQDWETFKKSEVPVARFRVDPGTVVLTRPARLYYGGGAVSGVVAFWRADLLVVNKPAMTLTQVVRTGAYPVPARARALQVCAAANSVQVLGNAVSHGFEPNTPAGYRTSVACADTVDFVFPDPRGRTIIWEIDV